jgi:hypothetical protein
MKSKLDLDEAVERSLNQDNTDEDIVAEYVENEKLEDEYYDKALDDIDALSLPQRVSAFIAEGPCCTKKCCASWSESLLLRHSNDLKRLSSNERKILLLSTLRNSIVKTDSTRYSAQRQRFRYTFRYEPFFGAMCSVAFRLLFDIKIKQLKGLLAHLKTSDMSMILPKHGNIGKKVIRSNSLDKRGSTKKTIKFMLDLAGSHGEYSSGRQTKLGNTVEDKNPDALWLPACFTRSNLLRMYHEQYPKYPISRTAFCSILSSEPKLNNILIRSPRTDMCDYCELQKRKIAGTKPHDEAKAEMLTAELTAHQVSYKLERAIYNRELDESIVHRKEYKRGVRSETECIEHISMDYGQSIAVPHTPDQLGGTFYLHMRSFLLFGIHSVLDNAQYCYTYDEREAGKGPNEVISFLHNYLANRTIKTLSLKVHADNCKGQNKNKFVMWYFLWLVSTGRLDRIEIKFMIKGHTHFIVDSNIGHTKRELRKSEVFCLDHWAKVINKSARTNKAKVVTGNDVYDWKTELSKFFTAFHGISKFQHFVADNSEPGWIWSKYGAHDETWVKTKLLTSKSSLKKNTYRHLTKSLIPVGFIGGKTEKEKNLFEKLRPYVRDEWKDDVCPDPEIFTPPERKSTPCPDW